MHAIQNFLHDQLFQVLSPAFMAWVLTYMVHSTLLIVVAFLATRWLKPRWSPLADTMWKVALVGGLVTATIQVTAGIQPFGGHYDLISQKSEPAPAATWVAENNPGPAPQTIALTTTAELEPESLFTDDEKAQANLEVTQSLLPMPLVEPPGGQDMRLVQMPSPVTSYRVVPDRRGMDDDKGATILGSLSDGGPFGGGGFPAILLGLWALGAVFGIVRLFVMRMRFEDQLANRREIVGGPLPKMLEDLRRQADHKRPIRLTMSPALSSPIALGSDEICLPEKALRVLGRDEQRCMLAHELSHLVRRDPSWLRFCCVLERVVFFQPLNRFARRRMQAIAEFLCDDFAAHHTGQSLTMARCLAEIASWVSPAPGRPLPVAGMAEKGSPLVQRVERLLDQKAPIPRIASPQYRFALAGGLLAAMVIAAPGITIGTDDSSDSTDKEGQVIIKMSKADGSNGQVWVSATADGEPVSSSTNLWTTSDGKTVEMTGKTIVFTGDDGKVQVLSGDSGEWTTEGGTTIELAEGGQTFVTDDGRTIKVQTTAEASGVQDIDLVLPQFQRPLRLGIVYEQSGEALSAQLGVHPRNSFIITKVYDDFPAAKGGIQKYDIVTKINGEEASASNLSNALKKADVGDTVQFDLLREGRPMKLTITIEEPRVPPQSDAMTWTMTTGDSPMVFFSDDGKASEQWAKRFEKAMKSFEMNLPQIEEHRIRDLAEGKAEYAEAMAKELRSRLEEASERNDAEMKELAKQMAIEMQARKWSMDEETADRIEEIAERMAELGEKYSEHTLQSLQPLEDHPEFEDSLVDMEDALVGFEDRMNEMEERLHEMTEKLEQQQMELEEQLELMSEELEAKVEKARVAYAASLSADLEKALVGKAGFKSLADEVEIIALDVAEDVDFEQISINDRKGKRRVEIAADWNDVADLLRDRVQEAFDDYDIELTNADQKKVQESLTKIAIKHSKFETEIED
ncbi:PDZ domain-containing protein [bacterium]|nr:PDZ domain-containing protein [bacterium]